MDRRTFVSHLAAAATAPFVRVSAAPTLPLRAIVDEISLSTR